MSDPSTVTPVVDVERLTYTIEQAAKALGIGRSHCLAQIRAGRLRVVRLGGRTLIPKAAVMELLNDKGAPDDGHD